MHTCMSVCACTQRLAGTATVSVGPAVRQIKQLGETNVLFYRR